MPADPIKRASVAIGAMLAAVIGLCGPARASADEAIGDPLPNPTQVWDALSADFDGLNGPDLVVTRHDAAHGNAGGIYYADGAGGWTLGFRFPTADRHGCTAGDVDGNGRVDLYCEVGAARGTGIGENELWLQQTDGSFLNRAAAWGVVDPFGRGRRPLLYDHNGDGRPDLYLTTWGRRSDSNPSYNRLYINTGTTFTQRTTAATGWEPGSQCVADADWDADRRRDLIVCGNTTPGANTLRLFRNTGAGQKDVSSVLGAPVVWPRDVQIADLNGDHLDDLVVVLQTRLEIRLNRGFGKRFSKVSTRKPLVDGQRAVVADLNGDGELDIYVSQGCDAGAGVPDKLFLGPRWQRAPAPPEPGQACGGEIVNAGSLVLFTGTEAGPGPVFVQPLPLALGNPASQ